MVTRGRVAFIIILSFISGLSLGHTLSTLKTNNRDLLSPLSGEKSPLIKRTFDKYSYESLRKRWLPASEIIIGDILKDDEGFTSRRFTFYVFEKKVSGLVNLPKSAGPFPIVVMFRGFVDNSIFTTGEGTRRTAEEFAKNGFVTLAPDFLGYGESDKPSNHAMEERFQTYTTALTLLSSIDNLPAALAEIGQTSVETKKVGIWGHSNGGQIAVTVLEVTGKEYPTVLWAPVSKPFPYSILYYTDEFEDKGKGLRKLVADFEKEYDVDKYSITSYLDWIKAPIQLHQGTADEAVPVAWSNEFAQELKKSNVDVTYYTYSGENHNFSSGDHWLNAVERSIAFYRRTLEDINK